MRRRIRERLTYGNVLATVAILMAMGGTSYAAALITSADIKNETIRSKDVKNRSLLAKDFKAGQLRRGPRGFRGARGLQGQRGLTGAPGGALAYARVKADGTVDTTRSKGISSANIVNGTGVYCFRNLPFTVKNAQVTLEGPFDVPVNEQAVVAFPTDATADTACMFAGANEFDLAVLTYNGGADTNLPFLILFN